ncbi:hypothetical protein BD779DRAFT_1440221 [Infundibulicybe gibba]|nr:hypothetical protein BD779DRAFT_1440221 [Infundibulicybe gibba]
MRLTLSEPTPLNATYTNEMGQALYKVDTPDKLFGTPVATISGIVPSRVRGRRTRTRTRTSTNRGLHDQFSPFAQVEWHTLGSSKIRMGGEEIRTKDFFRKAGWGWIGRHRIFTAPDEKEYKWKMSVNSTSLVTNDSAAVRVAKYRPKNHVVNRRPASLEISPAGEHMMDAILVTLIYIEMIRQDDASMPEAF